MEISPEHEADHSSSQSAEVKDSVELNLLTYYYNAVLNSIKAGTTYLLTYLLTYLQHPVQLWFKCLNFIMTLNTETKSWSLAWTI